MADVKRRELKVGIDFVLGVFYDGSTNVKPYQVSTGAGEVSYVMTQAAGWIFMVLCSLQDGYGVLRNFCKSASWNGM